MERSSAVQAGFPASRQRSGRRHRTETYLLLKVESPGQPSPRRSACLIWSSTDAAPECTRPRSTLHLCDRREHLTSCSPSPPLEERAAGRRPFYGLASADCSGAGPRLVFSQWVPTLHLVHPTGNAKRLRRKQTREEAQLWQTLRAGRFAGFKFRRQHPLGAYFLDFYCPAAQLAVELDGFGHGFSPPQPEDARRELIIAARGVEGGG